MPRVTNADKPEEKGRSPSAGHVARILSETANFIRQDAEHPRSSFRNRGPAREATPVAMACSTSSSCCGITHVRSLSTVSTRVARSCRRSLGSGRAGAGVVRAAQDQQCSSRKENAGVLESVCKEVQKCAICLMAAAAVSMPQWGNLPAFALDKNPAYSELGVLISGPPVKDPRALLRYALPISNKPIKEVQKSLEDISENLKLPGAKAIDPAERNVRQAARVLNQNKDNILADIAEAKKEQGQELLNRLSIGLQEFNKILDSKDRAAIASQQKELLEYVGDLEEAMVAKYPYEIPEEYSDKPLLKGRATVEMKVKVKDNPNLKSAVFQITLDGYNAPVTAGNFLDLVQRHFYDGMEVQRADGFVVQTGDPDGPAEGFVDPSTGKLRTIPLELMVNGDPGPIYGETLEELGRYKVQTVLPFNAFGTLAMARDEFENDSASSQVFWLLKESELTPSNANILDGRYAVFGYITENEDALADLKVGDVIESIKVVSGLDNLQNPSYKK